MRVSINVGWALRRKSGRRRGRRRRFTIGVEGLEEGDLLLLLVGEHDDHLSVLSSLAVSWWAWLWSERAGLESGKEDLASH